MLALDDRRTLGCSRRADGAAESVVSSSLASVPNHDGRMTKCAGPDGKWNCHAQAGGPRMADHARASAQNSATESVSALASGDMPARASRACGSGVRPRRARRSIFLRWPNAARVTASRAAGSAGASGAARGTRRTTDETTAGGHEGAGAHVEEPLAGAEPLCAHREAAVVAPRARGDSRRNLLLEHEGHALDPLDPLQPAQQEPRADVVGEVRHDPDPAGPRRAMSKASASPSMTSRRPGKRAASSPSAATQRRSFSTATTRAAPAASSARVNPPVRAPPPG